MLFIFSVFPDSVLHPAAHEAFTTNQIQQVVLHFLREKQSSWALIRLFAAEKDAQDGMTALERNKSSKGDQQFFFCSEKGEYLSACTGGTS